MNDHEDKLLIYFESEEHPVRRLGPQSSRVGARCLAINGPRCDSLSFSRFARGGRIGGCNGNYILDSLALSG